MTALTAFDLDDSGKIDLNGIYDRPDPRDYYQTLINLEYRIPDEAAPVFRSTIDEMRSVRRRKTLTILDVGCSYGVNAAILKHGQSMPELFSAYSARQSGALSRQDLIARDRDFYRSGSGDRDLRIVGLDVAARAVGYARQAGILDGGVSADLETQSPTPEETALLAPTDLVTSTGAIGYVGAPTFDHILDACSRQPWFALFALRMFPVDAIAATLASRGYAVFKLAGRTFKQRRFAGRTEFNEVLANLDTLGIDPARLETEGWYHAEFYFAHPSDEAVPAPISRLVQI
jgi:carnitine O-acetyltransferase